jgi:hypothetical protein
MSPPLLLRDGCLLMPLLLERDIRGVGGKLKLLTLPVSLKAPLPEGTGRPCSCDRSIVWRG